MDFGREKGVFPLVLIQVKSAAKRTVFGLKNKREKAFLPFKTQLFHIQVVRYTASEKNLFEGRKVNDRIVSIDRHYVRPIVRGKETKSVEFGAKVNNIQIDGISFIEHLSFKACNEGIRLKDCIRMQQKLMNVRVRCVAADAIYANNANRKFCTKYGISTSVRKGRRPGMNP